MKYLFLVLIAMLCLIVPSMFYAANLIEETIMFPFTMLGGGILGYIAYKADIADRKEK